MTLYLPGASLFYCAICGLGFILMYLVLPETENISLEDIELHFSDDSKKITNRKIIKSNDMIPLYDIDCSTRKAGTFEETEKSIENSSQDETGSDISIVVK